MPSSRETSLATHARRRVGTKHARRSTSPAQASRQNTSSHGLTRLTRTGLARVGLATIWHSKPKLGPPTSHPCGRKTLPRTPDAGRHRSHTTQHIDRSSSTSERLASFSPKRSQHGPMAVLEGVPTHRRPGGAMADLPVPSARHPLEHPSPPIIGLAKKNLVTAVDIENPRKHTPQFLGLDIFVWDENLHETSKLHE